MSDQQGMTRQEFVQAKEDYQAGKPVTLIATGLINETTCGKPYPVISLDSDGDLVFCGDDGMNNYASSLAYRRKGFTIKPAAPANKGKPVTSIEDFKAQFATTKTDKLIRHAHALANEQAAIKQLLQERTAGLL